MRLTVEQIKSVIVQKIEGKVTPDHDERGHFYLLPGGKRVASTTSKLIIEKPHLRFWAVKKGIEWLEVDDRFSKLSTPERDDIINGATYAHTEVRDDAGSVGSLAHKVAENYIEHWIKTGHKPVDIRQGFPVNSDPRSIAAARSVEAFFNRHDILPLASELLVCSEKRGSAGTLDFLAILDGKLALIDFKTSNNVSDDYALQVADYAAMFKEMSGVAIKEVKILHLSKDYDKFKVYNIPNLAKALKAFKGISNCYDWLMNGEKKLIEDKKIIKL